MTILAVLILILVSALGRNEDYRAVDSIKRAEMADCFTAGDRQGFFRACDRLIEYQMKHGTDKYVFDAYATKFDRQMIWGLYDDALATLEEMSSLAHARQSETGDAITEFCLGHFYLDTRQPREAEIHHGKAFSDLQRLGEDGRALRSGFNLQAIQMNLGQPQRGLAINDSTDVLLRRMEDRYGRISVVNRFKQARYRMRLLTMMDSLEAAAALKDTLFHYSGLLNDPVQKELVWSAMAELEQKRGHTAAAYSWLDSLISRFENTGNMLKTAQYRLSLAEFQALNGDDAAALESYRRYAAERDSAQIQESAEQLNVLAKQYELKELQLENRISRQRLASATVLIILLSALIVVVLYYAWSLRRKNRALYESATEAMRQEDEAEQASEKVPVERRTPEETLYDGLVARMHKDELFRNSELGRDDLAALMGTNRTFLSQAIKQKSGQTVSEFINHFRFRYTAMLLSDHPELGITEIGEMAGFASRSTMHRQFSAHFGMSPSDYRRAAQNRG